MEPPEERGSLSRYLEDVREFRVLDREEERRLLREIEEGREGAIERLVTSNLRFVIQVARDYRSLGVPLQDLLSEGNIGLIEAARRFDPRRGNKFATYAIWWIRKAILKAIAEQSHLVRVPYPQARGMRRIREAEERLTGRLGHKPSREELSRYLATTEAKLERTLERRVRMTSLDERVGEGADTLADLLEDSGRISAEQRSIQRNLVRRLFHAFRQLPRQQQLVIAMRFGLSGEPPQTLRTVGRRIGLSRERVRQIESDARQRMWTLIKMRRWRRARPARSTPTETEH